jgi:hypothetical protein
MFARNIFIGLGRILAKARNVAIAALLLLVVGCETGTQNLLTNGIGTQLAAPDVAQTQSLQRRYFDYLCQESGLVGSDYSRAAPSCILPVSDVAAWSLITQQGLNDIDRRCDSYLQWLDNKKRSKGPLISQIGATNAATTGILGVTGASASAITIVGLAFELLTKSIENYHSRLLLEVDHSTVSSVVLNSRRQFRESMAKERIQVENKPQAEYVLRSYLRLCLPFSIEANINNFSTLGSKGIAPTKINSIDWRPVVGNSLITSLPKGGARDVVKQTPPPPVSDRFLTDSVRLTLDERALAAIPGAPTQIQNALCVTPANGIFGENTRAAIKMAKRGANLANINGFRGDKTDVLDSAAKVQYFLDSASCVGSAFLYKNAFEKYAYPTVDELRDFQESIVICAKRLKQKFPNTINFNAELPLTGKFDDPTRTMITSIRGALKNHLALNEPISSQATDALDAKLNECKTARF